MNIYNDPGDVYRRRNRFEDASQQYRAAIAQGGEILAAVRQDPSLLVALAHAYNGIQDFQTAKRLIDDALLNAPNDPIAYRTLADSFRGFRRFDLALVALDKAKKLSFGNSSYIDAAIVNNREDLEKHVARTSFLLTDPLPRYAKLLIIYAE